MERAKRQHRSSVLDRASEETNFSSNSAGSAGRPKRMRRNEPAMESQLDFGPPSPATQDMLEEFFADVVLLKDEDGNELTADFHVLPSRKLLPGYYDTIRNPIDLKQIAMKLQRNAYSNLGDVAKDFILMADNAIKYNAPKSDLYNIAQTIRKFVLSKKQEIEDREKARTTERTVRTRRSTTNSTQPLSAIYAALEYEPDQIPSDTMKKLNDMVSDAAGTSDGKDKADDDEEESQESGSIFSASDAGNTSSTAMQELFKAVLGLKGNNGSNIIEPFMSLPSKKMYPDYYSIITDPICMNDVKRNMKRGAYIALDEMIGDIQLMCANAIDYNEPGSDIHKDAGRIAKFVETRLNSYRAELESTGDPLRNSLSGRMLRNKEDDATTKRMKFVVRSVLEYFASEEYPSLPFLEKPSKREYPEYYDIIEQPIDLKTIVQKVASEKYALEDDLMTDIKLLFKNATTFNEEKSQIYEDAVRLQGIAINAMALATKLFPDTAGSSRRNAPSPSRRLAVQRASFTPLQAALYEVFEAVVTYTDASGRLLSEHFMNLPSKQEMPEYYAYIKKPIDLAKIEQRIQHESYASLDDVIEDIGLCFENACSYNEPTSQLYKDAVVLLNIAMEKAKALGYPEADVPCVALKVQEIIHGIMDHMVTWQDANGRNLVDTLSDWTDSDAASDSTPLLTWESIRLNALHGRYRRLDRFQDDMFEFLEKVRFSSQPDNQLYEDAAELHLQFISKRDELCVNGTRLMSRAFDVSYRNFVDSIEQERKAARNRSTRDDSKEKSQGPSELPTVASPPAPGASASEGSVLVGSERYYVGDFVYIEPYEVGKQPPIICIENIVEDPTTHAVAVQGCYLLRPHETFHVPTKRFLEKELFRSDMTESHIPSKIIARCFVMEAKDYFKMKPVGFDPKDVYVCECRYSVRTKQFRKIKISGFPPNSRVQLLKREKPLAAARVPSVFATGDVDSGTVADKFDLCPEADIIDVYREDILPMNQPNPGEGQLYEQKDSPIGYLKIGDCALVRNENANYLLKIDQLLANKEERCFVKGTVFVFPFEMKVGHVPTKLFYKNEVFQTSREVVHPVEDLLNKCVILSLKDYSSCRLTEIPEDQVFVCDAKIVENGSSLKRNNKGHRFLNVTSTTQTRATPDEIFFFEKPVTCKRVVSPFLAAALSGKPVESDSGAQSATPEDMEVDDDTESVTNASETSSITAESPAASTVEVGKKRGRASAKKNGVKKAKYTVSGFILYGAEHRRTVKDDMPGLSFQETSRVVSEKWRSLSSSEKKKYEEEARRRSAFINEQLRKKGLYNLDGVNFKGLGCMTDMEVVAELERRVTERDAQKRAVEQQQAQANQSLQASGVKTILPNTGQIQMAGGQVIQQGVSTESRPDQNTLNLQQALQVMQAQQTQLQRIIQQQQAQLANVTRPIFMTLPQEPPKVKRALHSETFLKYLEANGMTGKPKPAVPYWKRQMTATAANTQFPSQIPEQFQAIYGGGSSDPESKNAGMEFLSKMWTTRNLMMAGLCGVQPTKASLDAEVALVEAAEKNGGTQAGASVPQGRR